MYLQQKTGLFTFAKGSSQCLVEHPIVSERAPSRLCARYGVEAGGFLPATIAMCVCVIIPFILDVYLVDAPAGVTQEEGRTGFLHLPSAVLALIFLNRSFPSSTVKSNFVY